MVQILTEYTCTFQPSAVLMAIPALHKLCFGEVMKTKKNLLFEIARLFVMTCYSFRVGDVISHITTYSPSSTETGIYSENVY